MNPPSNAPALLPGASSPSLALPPLPRSGAHPARGRRSGPTPSGAPAVSREQLPGSRGAAQWAWDPRRRLGGFRGEAGPGDSEAAATARPSPHPLVVVLASRPAGSGPLRGGLSHAPPARSRRHRLPRAWAPAPRPRPHPWAPREGSCTARRASPGSGLPFLPPEGRSLRPGLRGARAGSATPGPSLAAASHEAPAASAVGAASAAGAACEGPAQPRERRAVGAVWPQTSRRRFLAWGSRSIAHSSKAASDFQDPAAAAAAADPHETRTPIGPPCPPTRLARRTEHKRLRTSRRRGGSALIGGKGAGVGKWAYPPLPQRTDRRRDKKALLVAAVFDDAGNDRESSTGLQLKRRSSRAELPEILVSLALHGLTWLGLWLDLPCSCSEGRAPNPARVTAGLVLALSPGGLRGAQPRPGPSWREERPWIPPRKHGAQGAAPDAARPPPHPRQCRSAGPGLPWTRRLFGAPL
ncbi:transcription initiation factor TFIID subunit 4-like [Antechinus flavipes]|uniref:transcription initiation factor TFIID subunit 4-like n=1 Tax=Antechinus flavipes TaxID=38775 RepID=UPI002235D245|nr:transcription initiation factor TFIID subunit 4-like [Antechinus flavipes]